MLPITADRFSWLSTESYSDNQIRQWLTIKPRTFSDLWREDPMWACLFIAHGKETPEELDWLSIREPRMVLKYAAARLTDSAFADCADQFPEYACAYAPARFNGTLR